MSLFFSRCERVCSQQPLPTSVLQPAGVLPVSVWSGFRAEFRSPQLPRSLTHTHTHINMIPAEPVNVPVPELGVAQYLLKVSLTCGLCLSLLSIRCGRVSAVVLHVSVAVCEPARLLQLHLSWRIPAAGNTHVPRFMPETLIATHTHTNTQSVSVVSIRLQLWADVRTCLSVD